MSEFNCSKCQKKLGIEPEWMWYKFYEDKYDAAVGLEIDGSHCCFVCYGKNKEQLKDKIIAQVNKHRNAFGANYKPVCPDCSFDCEGKDFDDYLGHRKTHNQPADNNSRQRKTNDSYKVIYWVLGGVGLFLIIILIIYPLLKQKDKEVSKPS